MMAVERLPRYDKFKSEMRETTRMGTLGKMEKRACQHTSVMPCGLFCFQVSPHLGWPGLAVVVKASGSRTGLSLLAAHHCEPGPRQDPGGMKTAGFSEVHRGVSGGTASDHSASFTDVYSHCSHVAVGMVQGKSLLTTSSVFFVCLFQTLNFLLCVGV